LTSSFHSKLGWKVRKVKEEKIEKRNSKQMNEELNLGKKNSKGLYKI